jgi:hypothetical protein
VNKKSLLLFLVVVAGSATGLGLGWLIDFFDGGANGPVGAGVGGILGACFGAQVGYNQGLVEADWDRALWLMPLIGFGVAGGLANNSGFGIFFGSISAVIGSGVGVIAAKYMMRFFIEEPPPSIK